MTRLRGSGGRLPITIALPIALVLAGCGSTPGNGSPSQSGASNASPTSAPPAPSAITGSPLTPVSPSPSTPSTVGSLGPFPLEGCPLEDPAACRSAAQIAQAIVDGDHATVVELSWSDSFDCSALDAAMFPGCTSGGELVGYAFGTAAGTIDVLPADAYMARLDSVTGSIDPEFSDEAGDGRARVLGTSTCGPDDPNRRSHYVAWTAAASDADGPAERKIGLYELIFRDDAWRIGIAYLDTAESWAARNPEPLESVACGVTPWASP